MQQLLFESLYPSLATSQWHHWDRCGGHMGGPCSLLSKVSKENSATTSRVTPKRQVAFQEEAMETLQGRTQEWALRDAHAF